MNKTELVAVLARDSGLTKVDAARALDALTGAIATSLSRGESVAIAGFGTFEVRHRAARTGRNPKTGEAMDIGASKAPGFKPATALRKVL
jgi:DNA-binding protein HU-beta